MSDRLFEKAMAGSSRDRDVVVDVMRGIAIFTMIAANLAVHSLAQPPPFLLMLYGSFAATLFIFLAGVMVAYGSSVWNHSFAYFLLRAGLIVLVGAGIDVFLWGVFPFTTFDVLYLIGFSLPVAALVSRLKPAAIVAIAASFMLGGPILRAVFGYVSYPMEILLGLDFPSFRESATAIVSHWLIDGFFPIFPWTATMLLGVAFGYQRRTTQIAKDCMNPVGILTSATLIVIGCALWASFSRELIVRKGYSELFYPPTTGHFVTALGLVGAAFVVVDGFGYRSPMWFLTALGRHSLTIYVVHLIAIDLFSRQLDAKLSLPSFAVAYGVLTAGCVVLATFLDCIMKRFSRPPFLLRFFLGA